MNAVDDWIVANEPRLVALARDILRFDTTCVEPGGGDRHRNQEADCQSYLAGFLTTVGATAHTVVPDPAAFSDHPMMPPGHHWDGRPMTIAHLRGAGGGRNLVLNGHIDVVAAEPRNAWSAPPFEAEVVGDAIVARGAADMKGGIAAALFALEALRATGERLAGDVWVQLVTDEETNGMGTVALLDHQPPADAAVVPEPSAFAAWVACRGVLYGEIAVAGRAAHAELPQPVWQDGGAVGAIAKLRPVLQAIEELNANWAEDARHHHPLLAPPAVVPTLVRGGEFIASFPVDCRLRFDATYLPEQADERGYGSLVRAAIASALTQFAGRDEWLAHRPPRLTWTSDYPPYELSDGAELMASLELAGTAVGRTVEAHGLNAWHDAASLGRYGGIAAVSCGPGRPEEAHTVDEKIRIADLTDGARFFAALLLDFCGRAQ